MEDDKLKSDGMSFGDLRKKLDNFWYHYKTHTIIAFVLILTVVICTTQLVRRKDNDYCILYAGPAVLAVQDITYIKDAFKNVASDYDSNGEIVVAIDDIVILSPEEQEAANEDGAAFNPDFIKQSLTEFDQQIFGGDAVVCLLSPYMYERVHSSGGFLPLSEVFENVPESAYDECAVVLSDTDFGKYFNGINDLPEDTLICVRRLSTMAVFKGEAKTRKAHEANLELFRAIVGFEAPEDFTAPDKSADVDTEPIISITSIVDRTEIEHLSTAQALEGFYNDGEYEYYFSSIKSHYIDVYYSDGTVENVREAIEAGRVTISDLDRFEIHYYKMPIDEN